MIGIFSIGEADKDFKQENVTSIFYRLEKEINTDIGVFYDVYEFHLVNNGNRYYRHHEEPVDSDGERYLGAIFRDVRFGYENNVKENWNKEYKELIDNGYTLTGTYECDICGYSKRIE